MSRDRAHEAALSALFWALALALAPGDFPLDDDWAYASAVERWLGGGGLRLPEWGSPTLVAQLAWGALFCLPGGFSHGALRLSTLVLSWAGLLAFRRTLAALGAAPASATAATLGLLFNPLYFVLGLTFMTDVPGLALMLIAGRLFVAGVQEGRARRLAGAGLLAGLAALVRQTGLAFAAGLALWLWLRGERRWRRLAWVAGPAAAATAAHALWLGWAGAPFVVRRYLVEGTLSHLARPAEFAAHAAGRLSGAALLGGLFLLPWAWPRTVPGRRAWRAPLALAGLWLLGWALGVAPATGNIVGRFGLGPCSLGSSCGFKAAGLFAEPGFWAAAILAGAASALLLAARLAAARSAWRGPAGGLACGLGLAYLLTLLGASYFDRYALVLFPAALALLSAAQGEPASGPAAGPCRPGRLALLGLAAWSVLGSWDYLAWAGARWEGARRLIGLGIPAAEVSAGLEWGGMHAFEDELARLRRDRPDEEIGLDAWRERLTARAYVSFAPGSRGALERAGEVPYFCPLSLRTERLYLWVEPGRVTLPDSQAN